MKIQRTFLALALLAAPALASDDPSDSVTWGMKELQQASKSSADAFLAKHGAAAYDAVSAFSLERTPQGNAARAKITYKDGSGTKTEALFCHTHEGDIDCH